MMSMPNGLADGADFASVVDRDLFRHDDDLLEGGIDARKLCYAVAHAGRRQVDDAGIEGEPRIEAFAYAVEDRDVADGRLQHLAAPARRGTEHHIAAGEGMAHRRDLPGFAAKDVEHAHSIGGGSDLIEQIDAEIVRKPR